MTEGVWPSREVKGILQPRPGLGRVMSLPRIVSPDEWVAARKELQVAEEDAVRALEQIAGRRREMPAVRIEKDYVFEGPDGKASRPQLAVG